MNSDRTIVKGFVRQEEDPEPHCVEERLIPRSDESGDQGMNITWIIYTLIALLIMTIATATASLVINIQMKNQIIELKNQNLNE